MILFLSKLSQPIFKEVRQLTTSRQWSVSKSDAHCFWAKTCWNMHSSYCLLQLSASWDLRLGQRCLKITDPISLNHCIEETFSGGFSKHMWLYVSFSLFTHWYLDLISVASILLIHNTDFMPINFISNTKWWIYTSRFLTLHCSVIISIYDHFDKSILWEKPSWLN